MKKPSNSTVNKAYQKKLEKQLDALWGQIIKSLWRHKCGWPGCQYTQNLASHHYIHKAQGNLARWNLSNGIVLDFYHHIQVVHRQGYTEPIRAAIIQRIGQDTFDQMLIDVRKVWKPTIDQLEGLKSFFVATLDEIIVKETGI